MPSDGFTAYVHRAPDAATVNLPARLSEAGLSTILPIGSSISRAPTDGENTITRSGDDGSSHNPFRSLKGVRCACTGRLANATKAASMLSAIRIMSYSPRRAHLVGASQRTPQRI